MLATALVSLSHLRTGHVATCQSASPSAATAAPTSEYRQRTRPWRNRAQPRTGAALAQKVGHADCWRHRPTPSMPGFWTAEVNARERLGAGHVVHAPHGRPCACVEGRPDGRCPRIDSRPSSHFAPSVRSRLRRPRLIRLFSSACAADNVPAY
jgi:hypothetical protein